MCSFTKRMVFDVSNCDSVLIYFSLLLYQFLSHTVYAVLLYVIHIINCYFFSEYSPLYHYVVCYFSLYPITSLTLKCALLEINITSPAFFWLVLACYIFLNPLTFDLSESSYFKWGFFFFFFFFLFLICSEFCHTLKWNGLEFTCGVSCT